MERLCIHSNHIDGIRDGFRASVRTVHLGRQRQFAPGVIITGSVLETMRRLPRQRPAGFRLHLDPAQQIGYSLPRQQIRHTSAIIALCKRQRGVEGSSHDTYAHGADRDGGTIESAGDDGYRGTGRAEDVFCGHAEVCVLDVGPRAGGVAGRGDVTDDFEGTGGVSLDVGGCDEEDHDGGGGIVGGRGCGSADDTLEVCPFKVPTGAVGGPDLRFESIVCKVRRGWNVLLSLH